MHPNSILITGATGNVGTATTEALANELLPAGTHIWKGLRHMPAGEEAQDTRLFDFEDAATFAPALAGIQTLFLLRPPQLANVKKYFVPLLKAAKEAGVSQVVFLSVQGAEDSSWIPHHKIEAAIRNSGLNYTFLRPAYFMQNFLTTLHPDLVQRNRIFLPAGKAAFTLVDVADVGAVAARILLQPQLHTGKAYALTSNEQLTFGQMAEILTTVLGRTIEYTSPNLLRFFWAKKKEGLSAGFILIMILLHYLPRFQKPPAITHCISEILGRPATLFEEWAETHVNNLQES